MVLITVTNIREKFILALKLILLLLLLGMLVPKLYTVLSAAGSLHRWAENGDVLREPMRVENVLQPETAVEITTPDSLR